MIISLNIRYPDSYKKVLPFLMVLLFGQERYLPKIEWSSKSWTHNIFRFYEKLFWRRYGIRKEETTWFDETGVHHECFTFEALCANFETKVRKLLDYSWLFQPNIQWQRGAIAFDAETDATTSTSFSKTCTGSNLVLTVGVLKVPNAGMTVSYNAIAMTNVINSTNVSTEQIQLWIQTNPSSGANNVTNTVTPNATYATSYTGCAQSSQPDANTESHPTATTVTLGLTSVVDNCWAVAMVRSDTATVGVTSGPISQARGTANTQTWRDTNGAVAAGSQSTVYNDGGSSCGWCCAGMSISPVQTVVSSFPSTLLTLKVG